MVPGESARRKLLEFNTEKIEQVYLQGKAKGMADPVILVLDLRDDFASKIAKQCMSEEKRDAMLADAATKNMFPVAVAPVKFADALQVFGGISPAVEKALKRPLPAGHFWAIAVAEGGRSYVGMEIPE